MGYPFASTRAQDTVLDFLNTVFRHDGRLVDRFHRDEDVVAWLDATPLRECYVAHHEVAAYCGLAGEARQLREHLHQLIAQRKAGAPLHISLLNHLLASGSYWTELIDGQHGRVSSVYRFAAETPRQVLMPVMLAAAELLARDDFSSIRQCAAPSCVFWFLDRSRSHRRRWCSMATCCNRHKGPRFFLGTNVIL